MIKMQVAVKNICKQAQVDVPFQNLCDSELQIYTPLIFFSEEVFGMARG